MRYQTYIKKTSEIQLFSVLKKEMVKSFSGMDVKPLNLCNMHCDITQNCIPCLKSTPKISRCEDNENNIKYTNLH